MEWFPSFTYWKFDPQGGVVRQYGTFTGGDLDQVKPSPAKGLKVALV